MVQLPLRVVLGGVLVLSVSSAAFPQATPARDYGLLVSRYADGAHVASVLELLTWPVAGVVASARAGLEQQTRLYERGRDPELAGGRLPGDVVIGYLRHLRAAAALHLEASIAAPASRVTLRNGHLSVAEAAFRELDDSRPVSWKRDTHVTAGDRDAITRFRRDWWLIATTHFQRTGAFADALRFATGALAEFDDDPVFHVIVGSIFAALAAPVATFDVQRAFVGLPHDPDEAAREALQRAARSFARALALRPDDAEARVRMARVQVQLGALDAARDYLRDDVPPGRLAYLLALTRGHLAESQGQHDVAADHYREATTVSNQWQSACFALSHVLVRLGQHDQARSNLRGCLETERGRPDPWQAYPMGLEWLVDPTVRQLRGRVSGTQALP